jgi:hypothetical protein
MSNVLDHEKQQQILALGRLGWTLRRIEEATGIRRETVSGYLRAAARPGDGQRQHRGASDRDESRRRVEVAGEEKGVNVDPLSSAEIHCETDFACGWCPAWTIRAQVPVTATTNAFSASRMDKLLHRWEDRRLHVRACGVATAIERTDLLINAP